MCESGAKQINITIHFFQYVKIQLKTNNFHLIVAREVEIYQETTLSNIDTSSDATSVVEDGFTSIPTDVQHEAKGFTETNVDHPGEVLQKPENTTFRMGKFFMHASICETLCKSKST